MNMNTKIRVMTNNVKRDVKIAERAGLMMANYRRSAPDVLGLQECDPLAYETVVNPMSEYGYALAGAVVAENGEHSRTPILYRKDRFETVEEWSGFFTDRYTNSKTYSVAVLREQASGKLFALLNVHFAIIIGRYPKEIGTDAEVGNQWRIGNAKQVLGIAKSLKEKYGNIPLFLTGDFNSTSQHEPYRVLGRMFTDALTMAYEFCSVPTGTFHPVGKAPDPQGLPLDYIFVTQDNTDVVTCEILNDEDMINSTDHCAVVADLMI